MPTSDIKKGPLYVDSTNNRVGIGTVSPYSYGKLTVKGGNGTQLVLDNAGEQYTQMYFLNNGTDKGSIWVDNSLSLFSFTARSGMGMNFYTNNSEAMRIDSSGNVGIGSVPSYKLHVEGVGNQFIFLNNASTNDGLYLKAGAGASSLQTNGGSHTMNFYTSGTERLRIDSSGRVTMPYQPAFLAYLVTTTGKATSVSVVPGTFATYYNVGGHYSTSTKRFTAPVAGLYLFTGTIATEGSAGSFNYLSCEFWVNGSRTFVGGWQGNSSPSYSKSASSVVLSLSASDYVELACETNKAFNIQGGSANYTYFNGYLVG